MTRGCPQTCGQPLEFWREPYLWLLVGNRRRGRGGLAVVAPLHALLLAGLHGIPLFLLIRIEQASNLAVGRLVNVHHLGAPIGRREGRIGVDLLHIGARRLQNVLHLRLLVGAQVQLLGQYLTALLRIQARASHAGASLAPPFCARITGVAQASPAKTNASRARLNINPPGTTLNLASRM